LVLLLLLPFQSALPQSPGDGKEQLQQANTAFHAGYDAAANGDLLAAKADFQKAVQLAPEIAEGHSALGSVLLQLGDSTLAIPELERALAIKGDDRSAQINLAVAYEQSRDYDKSVGLFRSIDQDPSDPLPPSAILSYVRALTATQSPGLAMERLQKAVADAAPNSADAATLHDALGSLLAQRQDWPLAQAQFEQALANDPSLGSAHEHLGLTLVAEGRTADAVRELSIASNLAPQNAAAQMELGRALIVSGEDDKAIPVLQKAVELAPDFIDAKYQLAVALQRTGQEQQSIPLFRQVVEVQPHNAPALTNLALALVQTGNSKEAIALYQRALAEALRKPQAAAIERQERSRILGTRVRFARFESVPRNEAADETIVVLAVLAQHEAQLLAGTGRANRLPRCCGFFDEAALLGIDAVNAVGLPRADPQELAVVCQRLRLRRGRRDAHDL